LNSGSVKNMKYIFFLIFILTACRNKTQESVLKTRLDEAVLQKDNDSIALARFKAENANQFKLLDSLIKIKQIKTEQQIVYDSLMQKGVNLGMKFVRDIMKINAIKKEQE
jgi:hypothetical protein